MSGEERQGRADPPHQREAGSGDRVSGEREHAEPYGRTLMIGLGLRIRMIREQANLTQAELSKQAGVGADMISRLENAHYPSPGLRTILRVSEGLGVPLAQLFRESAPHAPHRDSSQLERITDLCLRLNGEELALATEFIALLVRRQR